MHRRRPILYYRRGPVDRRRVRAGWQRYDGFSPNSDFGNPVYPWKTRLEAQVEAKAAGGLAVFCDEKGNRIPWTK